MPFKDTSYTAFLLSIIHYPLSIIHYPLSIYLVIKLLNPLERLLGKGGLTVIRKFMGVILLAIAVKIFKTNL